MIMPEITSRNGLRNANERKSETKSLGEKLHGTAPSVSTDLLERGDSHEINEARSMRLVVRRDVYK